MCNQSHLAFIVGVKTSTHGIDSASWTDQERNLRGGGMFWSTLFLCFFSPGFFFHRPVLVLQVGQGALQLLLVLVLQVGQQHVLSARRVMIQGWAGVTQEVLIFIPESPTQETAHWATSSAKQSQGRQGGGRRSEARRAAWGKVLQGGDAIKRVWTELDGTLTEAFYSRFTVWRWKAQRNVKKVIENKRWTNKILLEIIFPYNLFVMIWAMRQIVVLLL